MAKQCEFLVKQQALAYHVARLPILRSELEEARKCVDAGLMGNCLKQSDAYYDCMSDIKQLAAAL